jgi:Fibronectin type III domain
VLVKARQALRARAPMVVVVLACVLAVTAAITGAVAPVPGLQFVPGGHWVFNSALQTVFHIDGATASVDAQASVPGDRDSHVVQGDTSGFVVGRTRTTEFGKSNLSVVQSTPAPADEIPALIEAAGGPYAVYRNAGIVVRFGEPPATMPAGGPLGDPVVTTDGTLWLFRTTSGLLCKLPRGGAGISACPVKVPQGHTGALTVVGDRPRFVDTSTGTLHQVYDNRLGGGQPLGVHPSAKARPASTDVAGRVAILDPAEHRMHLVDTKEPAGEPITVPLTDGDYDGPTSTGSAVVLVDRKSNTVLTYDAGGTQRDAKPMPKEKGDPRIHKGEDSRVYVDGAEGAHVAVVDKEGKVADVPVPGKPATPNPEQKAPEQKPAEQPADNKPAERQGPPAHQEPPNRPENKEPPPKQAPPTVPASAPGAPTAVSASAGDGSATLSWGPAADNRSPITGYVVSWQDGAGRSGSLTTAGTARGATVPNLTNGTRYTITVAALNRIGRGPAVAANPVTPVAAVKAPGAPQNLAIDATTKHVDATVTWTAAPPNGAPVTAYHVSWRRDDGSRPGSEMVPGTTLSRVIQGIWAGAPDVPFTVTVVAENSAGQGPPASAHKAPPPKNPAIAISRGAATSSGSCKAPACAWINTTLTGFDSNTRVSLTAIGNGRDFSEPCVTTTDDNGAATCNTTRYDVAGAEVYVYADTPDGRVTSNTITWTNGGARAAGTVSVARGGPGAWPGCDPTKCYKMRVTMSGFTPNTRYVIKPFSSNPDYSNEGSSQTTDANGAVTFEAFDYSISGSTVWVVVSTPSGQSVARSADYFWE